jgi:hypothetical protein
MVGDGLNDFKFLDYEDAIDDLLDLLDLGFTASTLQTRALDAELGARLVEGVSEFEKINIGGLDELIFYIPLHCP